MENVYISNNQNFKIKSDQKFSVFILIYNMYKKSNGEIFKKLCIKYIFVHWNTNQY